VVAPKIDNQEQIVTDGDMSGDVTSAVVEIAAYRHQAVQAVWTGTPAGNLQLEASNDGTDWTARGSPVAAGGAAGSHVFVETYAAWAKTRLKYTSSSSTGVLQAFSIVKE